MARISSPKFRLFSTRLDQAQEQKRVNQVIEVLFPEYGIDTPQSGFTTPLALRWTTQPSFAFARQPFKVWRKVRTYKFHTIMGVRRSVSGTRVFHASQGEIYRANIEIALAAGQHLVIEALDREGKAIPGQVENAAISGLYTFRSPFMKMFRFRGNGEVVRIQGVVQSELINDPSWELIQEVGFPFKTGSIAAPDYDPDPQGWTAAPPIDAWSFHMAQLRIAEILHEDMPDLPAPGLPRPAWHAADPAGFMFELAESPYNLLDLIRKCLVNTNDGSPNPKDRQQAFLVKRTVEGLRQDGFPGIVEPATAMIPVVSTTMLSVSTDNYASLGLGYGTYDFPPYRPDLKDYENVYDYMVTNEYLVRPFGINFMRRNYSVKIEFAALSEARPRPETPNLMRVERMNQNRPLGRDVRTDETVQLTFNAPTFPQGYGIVKSDSASKVTILNNERLYSPGSYNPHIPDIPNPENVPGANCTFTDSTSPVPLHGQETYNYFIAGIDQFGRWSAFGRRMYTAKAIPPQAPGLTSLKLTHNEPLPPGAPATMPCTLEIECTWDWTERSPEIIQIGGGFYPADKQTTPFFMDRFSHESGNSPQPLIVITFAPDGKPSVSGAGHSVDEIIPANPAADPNLKRYKVIVSDITSTFPGPLLNPATPPAMDPSRVAFAATARALEKVRATAMPQVWSKWVNPVTDKLDDPRPPVVTPFVARVNWTALPDAANTARGKLTWRAVPRAAGYVVWEAPETALREFLGLAQRPDDSLVDRATELTLALGNPVKERDSLKAFVRLNRDLIRETSVELALPGSADTLFAYRISAMSVSNVESSRTNATYFAVPRQSIPGQPRLKLEVKQSGTPGIEVIALRGAGPPPAGYKVYRVRKQMGSNVVQMKGLPVFLEDHAGWSPYQLKNLDGSVTEGMKILDPVTTPSWKPYYYQVVAVGEENELQGLLRGESAGSTTEAAFFPPEAPPNLTLTGNVLTSTTHLIAFTSNIPLKKSAIGNSTLELMSYQPPAPGKMPKRITIFAGEVHKLKRSLRSYRPHRPPLPDISTVPDIALMEASRTFFVRMNPDIRKGIIKMVDPLGRTTEIQFDGP